jgi:hypothetical protein
MSGAGFIQEEGEYKLLGALAVQIAQVLATECAEQRLEA